MAEAVKPKTKKKNKKSKFKQLAEKEMEDDESVTSLETTVPSAPEFDDDVLKYKDVKQHLEPENEPSTLISATEENKKHQQLSNETLENCGTQENLGSAGDGDVLMDQPEEGPNAPLIMEASITSEFSEQMVTASEGSTTPEDTLSYHTEKEHTFAEAEDLSTNMTESENTHAEVEDISYDTSLRDSLSAIATETLGSDYVPCETSQAENIVDSTDGLMLNEERTDNNNGDYVREQQSEEPIEVCAVPEGKRALDNQHFTLTDVDSPYTAQGTHRTLYPNLDELALAYSTSRTEDSATASKLKPFSESQLRSLYYNNQLEHQEDFVNGFLQDMNQDKHEFYEIVQNYYRARNHLASAEHDIQVLRNDCVKKIDMVWETKTETIILQGQCVDKTRVSAEHGYDIALFNDGACQDVERSLKNIRCHIHDELSLYAYEAQLSRLQVESYLHTLYTDNPALRDMPKNAPVTAWLAHQLDVNIAKQVSTLKSCISILFTFQRKPAKDDVFVQDTRRWLATLVGTLLRTASLGDHLFLLHHILRCPPGLSKWAKSFLQVLPPGECSRNQTWGSPLLDHIITTLATILRPVKKREEVLYQVKVTLTPPPDKVMDNPWILVDSEGEEDEDPENSWWLLHENDVVSLLNQLPIQAMFAHVLYVTHSDEGRLLYNIEHTSEAGFLKLVAFAYCLLEVLGDGLQTFSQGRYRQLNKRLGRMIRHTVHYVADHWENFREAYSQVLPAGTLQRLQLELDQLVHRAAVYLLAAQRLGSWQFLTDMPYRCMSLDMMWQLLWLMHQGHQKPHPSQSTPPDTSSQPQAPLNYCKMLLQDVDTQLWFEEKLTTMPINEATFLLTTFANMARSRPVEDIHFIETVTCEIYEIAYLWSHTREFCSKPGRQLLASIAIKHPCIVSTLLSTANGSMDRVGMVSVYLFRELPVHLWCPKEGDLALLREWLLDQPPSSPHNQLARLVLEKLNWGKAQQSEELFLDVSLHRQVALLVMETYKHHLSGKVVGGLFTEGLTQGKAGTPTLSDDQQVASWAWDMALKLCLHGNACLGGRDDMATIPDVQTDPGLQPIQQGVADNYAIAAYLALVMGKQSHNVGDFCSGGVRLLATLVDKSHFVPGIRALSYVAPMFYTEPQYLTGNKEFMQTFQILLGADAARKSYFSWEFPGPVTKLLCCMIQGSVSDVNPYNSEGSVVVVLFWVTLLTSIPNWVKERGILYILDKLIEVAYMKPGGFDAVLEYFSKLYKQHQSGESSQGVLSALVSWLATSPSSPGLLDAPSCPEFPWYAYACLHAETELEEETGLWKEVQRHLGENPTATVDQALKKATSKLKLDALPGPHRLCVYRWAQQALETAETHPLLPLLWQRFFLLYLGRLVAEPGLPQRGSVGEKFFESTSHISLMKRMKKRLADTASHCHTLAAGPQREEEGDDRSTLDGSSESHQPVPEMDISNRRLHLQSLVKFYQTLSFWLDEPRLHDASLYLPALPPQYESDRLLMLFQNDKNPWHEFVDCQTISKELNELTNEWTAHKSHDLQADHWNGTNDLEQNASATSRILSRLQKTDPHTPPPPLEVPKAPVPTLDPAILCNQHNLLYALRSDFTALVDFARLYCLRVSRHVGLDMSFVELLPDHYKNEMTEAVVTAQCKSSFNPMHRCKGPATITTRYEAKTRNDIVSRKIDENRAEYKQLMIEAQLPPPQNVCGAAVHVENTITDLIKLLQGGGSPQMRASAREVGTALFYHMAGFVSEDTKYYPPTRQFFSACIEILGQEFIRNNPTQSQPLLASILQMPSLVSLLAPNFSPNASPELFITMYQDMLPVPQNKGPEVAFTLLTKFDVGQWLATSRPSLSQRATFIDTLTQALYMCGAQPSDQLHLVFQIYRLHLQQVLCYHFPDHFGAVLKLLLKGCEQECISTEVWQDFLSCIGCQGGTDSGEFKIGERKVKQVQEKLSYKTLLETIDWLSSYFMRQRVTSSDSASFGLYPKWKSFIDYLATFNSFLATSLVNAMVTNVRSGNMDPEQGISLVWDKVTEMFAPWIQPLDNNDQILSPCILNDITLATQMVTKWLAAVDHIQLAFESLVPAFCQSALSHLWPYYVHTLAKKGVPSHVLQMYHMCLEKVAWDKFCPDIQAVQLMLKVHEGGYPDSCCEFLGQVVTSLQWRDIVSHYVKHDIQDIVQQLHTSLFTLLVRLATHTVLLESTPLPQLLAAAESFNWNYIAAHSYEQTVTWFLGHCDPKCVLAERSSKSSQVLSLLKTASGFVMVPNAAFHPETPVKRCTYVRCLIQLISKCSHLKDVNQESFKVLLVNLLTEVEAVIGTVSDASAQQQEATSLSTEVLASLNTCNPTGGSCAVLLAGLLGWLEASPCSPLLLPLLQGSCRCLASLAHMSAVVEACMDAHFTRQGVAELDLRGWGPLLTVLQVPELSREQFLGEAVAQGSYLTLYAFTLQQLPLCQSLNDERGHLDRLVDWTTLAKPSGANGIEAKLVLWWSKLVELMIRQLDFGGDVRAVVHSLLRIIPALLTLGEDRASGGLMGAIGFGRKSHLSTKFRLLCRVLATFLASQVPTDASLRRTPSAPGYLSDATRGSARRRSSGSASPGPAPSQSAQQALAQLESLRNNKQYSAYKHHLEFGIGFITNPANCVRDTPSLLLQMVRNLYPETSYLAIVFEPLQAH